jgi:hypothetical protein
MGDHKNCPNCAAPYDPAENRCPYCGTAYFDLTTIDFDGREPFYLKIRTCGYLITQLVVPETLEFNDGTEYAEFHGGLGNMVQSRIKTSEKFVTNLGFHGIPSGNGNGEMVVIQKLEGKHAV